MEYASSSNSDDEMCIRDRAYADSIPMVAITGQVNSSLLGRDVFQEADMRGATESFVKYSYLVKNPDEIPRIMKLSLIHI